MTKEEMMKNVIVVFDDSIECDDDNQTRPEWKHRTYTINEHLYFDYWDEDEWEFSIQGDLNEKESEMYFRIIMTLSQVANDRLCIEDIQSFLNDCKRLIDYAKRVSA